MWDRSLGRPASHVVNDALDNALARLDTASGRTRRLGLERMIGLLGRLGLEGNLGSPGGAQYIHVAGTNGKGSTTRFVECVLESQGLRSGATYSPYVHDVTERIHVGGSQCGRNDMARWINTVLDCCVGTEDDELGHPTEFECKTAAAFLAWKENCVEWVALEVGLGGRLDATNVVDPACSVVVSIGFDHTEYLGDTLAAIAREKAGIIKPGRPVVVGELPPEALEAVEAVARANDAPLWRLGCEIGVEQRGDGWTAVWPGGSAGPFRPGMAGVAMPANAALALAACARAGVLSNPAAACAAIECARLPGRMERRTWRGKSVVLDGAHNAEAARCLAASLGGGVDAVIGMLDGHNAREFGAALAPVVRRAFVVPVAWFRSRVPAELAAELEAGGLSTQVCDTLDEGLDRLAASDASTLLVTGSFYLVGDSGRLLGRG